jgi:hypothetical protein
MMSNDLNDRFTVISDRWHVFVKRLQLAVNCRLSSKLLTG